MRLPPGLPTPDNIPLLRPIEDHDEVSESEPSVNIRRLSSQILPTHERPPQPPVAKGSFTSFNMPASGLSLIGKVAKFIRRLFQTKTEAVQVLNHLRDLTQHAVDIRPLIDDNDRVRAYSDNPYDSTSIDALKDPGVPAGSYVLLVSNASAAAVRAKLASGDIVTIYVKRGGTVNEALSQLSEMNTTNLAKKLLNGDTTTALRKAVSGANPKEVSDRILELLTLTHRNVQANKNAPRNQMEQKERFASAAGLCLVSALNLIPQLNNTDRTFIAPILDAAKATLIEKLPPRDNQREKFHTLLTDFYANPITTMTNHKNLQLLAGLAIQYDPTGIATADFLNSMGSLLNSGQRLSAADIEKMTDFLLALADNPSANLGVSDEQKEILAESHGRIPETRREKAEDAGAKAFDQMLIAGATAGIALQTANAIRDVVATQSIGGERLVAGKTYKHSLYSLPFSIIYNEDGTAIVKLKGSEVRTVGKGSFGSITFALRVDIANVNRRKAQLLVQKTQKGLAFTGGWAAREETIYGHLRGCKGLIKLHRAVVYPGTRTRGGRVQETESKHGMFMEWAPGGDLLEFINNGSFRALPEREQLSLFKQILQGVQEIHQKDVIHFDLKPENLLLIQKDGRYEIRIMDLGLARHTSEIMETGPGSVNYAAPELFHVTAQNPASPNPAMDAYSIGRIATYLFPLDYRLGRPSIRAAITGLTEEKSAARMTIPRAIELVDQRLAQL